MTNHEVLNIAKEFQSKMIHMMEEGQITSEQFDDYVLQFMEDTWEEYRHTHGISTERWCIHPTFNLETGKGEIHVEQTFPHYLIFQETDAFCVKTYDSKKIGTNKPIEEIQNQWRGDRVFKKEEEETITEEELPF